MSTTGQKNAEAARLWHSFLMGLGAGQGYTYAHPTSFEVGEFV